MLKLVRLEWKKNNIGKYICGVVVLAALLCFFIMAMAFLGIANDPDGTLDAAPGAERISASIDLFTGMAFLICTSVMMASFIVSAYKNKTMQLMFSYPIKRQKILAAQMIAVWSFNVAALVLTKLAIYACVAIGAGFFRSFFVVDFNMGSASFYIRLLLQSLVIVNMGFIALFVGMAMKSLKATIVTSFLLIFLTEANVGDLTLSHNATLPAILTILSFAAAGLAMWKLESRDLV